jgi:mannose-6-phosphate isomerase-like protein (cupin superfamily)
MSNSVVDKASARHYLWGNNCASWILADTEGLSVKYESMSAGTSEQLHFHNNAQQFFYILSGRAVLYLDNEKVNFSKHQGLLIHPGGQALYQEPDGG